MSYEPLTDDELTAIKARVEAATPGPWRSGGASYGYCVYGPDDWAVTQAVMINIDFGHGVAKDNAEFVAHARTDIPRLLATITALKERIKEAEERLCDAWETGLGEDA